MMMRERIARALYAAEKARADNAVAVLSKAGGRPATAMAIEPWEECCDCFLSDADAVLAALREPTEEMLDAAHDPVRTALNDFRRTGQFASVLFSEPIWTSMIDATRTTG